MNYLPEGRLLHTPENQRACASLPALRRAAEQGTILEGQALVCTAGHDLTVSVGGFTGTIPREEAALGIREGTAREIAILSRVGRPVCFVLIGFDFMGDAPRLLLSRRRAQERALESLLDTAPGTVLPATVTHLERFGAFVDIGCGVISMIGVEACSVSRIDHPAQRFVPGQEIYAVVTGTDREKGRIYLSHRELLGTWEENAARFSPGMTVPAVVRGVMSYGTFLELSPNLTGLSDRSGGLSENERASVYIKGILPEKLKIKLIVLEKLPPLSEPEPLTYYITEGRLRRWQYTPDVCRKARIETVFP